MVQHQDRDLPNPGFPVRSAPTLRTSVLSDDSGETTDGPSSNSLCSRSSGENWRQRFQQVVMLYSALGVWRGRKFTRLSKVH